MTTSYHSGVRPFLSTGLLLVATACATTQDNGSQGTPGGCTEIGCADGLVVQVTPTAAWPAGEYRFTIEADGATTTCTGSLPLPECGTPAIRCDATGVTIGESGCALAPAEHAFSDIMFTANPASVTIEVDLDEQRVGSQSWSPSYQQVQPNGPDCEPTCTNATVALALTFG